MTGRLSGDALNSEEVKAAFQRMLENIERNNAQSLRE